jgi:diacylglycerol diphosphate phosphatase/phosphatidate phosphatase
MAHPAPTRSFAVTFADGEVVYPEFAYPMRKEIIPIWLAAFLATVIPIVVILAMQVRVRSFWDANNAILGLLYGVITAAVFQVFIKWLIGGLRPHFLTVCKPDISRASNQDVAEAGYNAKGFRQLYFTDEVCTGDRDEIDDSLESMPSGHTTAAFAGFVFLYLYLNAKLKVFSNYHPALWKLVAIYAPILGACLIGGALTIDEFHNWYDILAGAIIGTVFAVSAYRMTYAAVWDWRFNHIPLHRGAPFAHASPELGHATFTRRAEWGEKGAYGAGSGVGHRGVGHDGVGHHGAAAAPGYGSEPYGNGAAGVGHHNGVLGGGHYGTHAPAAPAGAHHAPVAGHHSEQMV